MAGLFKGFGYHYPNMLTVKIDGSTLQQSTSADAPFYIQFRCILMGDNRQHTRQFFSNAAIYIDNFTGGDSSYDLRCWCSCRGRRSRAITNNLAYQVCFIPPFNVVGVAIAALPSAQHATTAGSGLLLCKISVLTQESISRVNAIYIQFFRKGDYLRKHLLTWLFGHQLR